MRHDKAGAPADRSLGPYAARVVSTPVIEYRGAFDFPVPPEDVWDAMGHLDQYERWWWWLSEFRVEGDGLAPGSVLHGVVAPPLPYRMRLAVVLEDCLRPSRVDAVVHGDLEGWARLRLDPRDAGSRLTVEWTIEMMQHPMRLASRLAHPVLRWGHDRVVDATVHSFRRHLPELA